MTPTPGTRYFFVHIMKTGGATFRQHVYANFAEDEVYPRQKHDDMGRAWLIDELLSLPPERRQRIRAYTGHFPYVAAELLGLELVTMTILRDPVDRTVSYLKHCKRHHAHHRDLTLEQIYEDQFYFRSFIRDHQTKIYAMTPDDRLESYMDVIDIDDDRLAVARRNLAKVDVIALTEHHGALLDEMHDRYGWTRHDLPRKRVAKEPWTASAELRARIAEDNPYDLAFYEYARELVAQRERERERERSDT